MTSNSIVLKTVAYIWSHCVEVSSEQLTNRHVQLNPLTFEKRT